MRLLALAPVAVIAAGVLACSTGEPAAPHSGARAAGPPTYHRDVAPLLARSCIKCHQEGGIGPFSLTSFAQASAMAPALSAAVIARTMPPWGAQNTAECAPPLHWRQDERLSDDEIAMLARWQEAGTPEGDPADSPVEVAPLQSLNLAVPTVELEPRQEYVPTSTDTDELRCFVIDAPIAEAGAYLSAVHVVPGNRAIVHHVSVYTDIGGIASRRAGPDGSFDCSGASLKGGGAIWAEMDGQAPNLGWLLAWAPGGRPLELPSNLGIELAPHSKIVMEVHYSAGSKQPAPDRTRLQLVVSPTKPEFVVAPWTIGNFGAFEPNGDGLQPGPSDGEGVTEFLIPAQSREHVETMITTVAPLGEPMPIFGLRAHAHLSAVDIKVDVLRPEQPDQCLLQDKWDFHWQRVYTYDASIAELPTLYGGEKVRVRCTYDNSMFNRRLASELSARGLRPMDIKLGDATLDEMCMVDLLYVKRTP